MKRDKFITYCFILISIVLFSNYFSVLYQSHSFQAVENKFYELNGMTNPSVPSSPIWWDTNWLYRRNFIINNPNAKNLTNFQVKISLDNLTNDYDLVGSWHFNENNGSVISDSSGNGFEGTRSGASWTDGVEGSSLSFDGINDYCTIPHQAEFNSDNQTVALWVRSDLAAPLPGAKGLIDRMSDTSWDRGLSLAINASGYVQNFVTDGVSEAESFYSTSIVTDGDWHFIVAVKEYDVTGDMFYIYVDGEFENSLKTDFHQKQNTDDVNIGRISSLSDPDRYLDGNIDEIKIYNQVLTSEQIKEQFAIGATKLLSDGEISQAKYDSFNCSANFRLGSYIGDDLRIVDSNNNTVDFWIENDESIWMEVPYVAANSDASFYIYYGNSSATSVSSGKNTFLAFDDFEDYTEGQSINETNNWIDKSDNSSEIVSISESKVLEVERTSSNDKDIIYNNWTIDTECIVHFEHFPSYRAGLHMGYFFGYDVNRDLKVYVKADGGINWRWYDGSNLNSMTPEMTWPMTTWKTYDFYVGDDDLKCYDGTLHDGGLYSNYDKGISSWQFTSHDTYDMRFYIDNFYVRKYAAVEPNMTTIAIEETILNDEDFDYLLDSEEIIYGTNSTNPDTDADGLRDGYEVKIYFSDPLLLDTDSDGLNDSYEVLILGTDPSSNDTDSDGLTDNIEILTYNTDPLKADSDNDLLNDYNETILLGTNPLSNDTDSDLMCDFFEVTYSLNPLVNDSSGDLDVDLLTNLYEHDNGLLPNNNDTDSDGVTDGNEVLIYFSNPKNNDTDSDLLGDFDEIFTYFTNPNNWDTDSDLYSDYLEITEGSDPNNSSDIPLTIDSDADGLLDYIELQIGTDAFNSDTDNDGLTDGAEYNSYNTNPLLNDTDSDLLTDYEEIITYSTNPLSADSDNDTILDYEEVNLGSDGYITNPNLADSDSDGLTDYEEISIYSTDPNNSDSDGDGYTDLDEINAKSDPNDSKSVPPNYPLIIGVTVATAAVIIILTIFVIVKRDEIKIQYKKQMKKRNERKKEQMLMRRKLKEEKLRKQKQKESEAHRQRQLEEQRRLEELRKAEKIKRLIKESEQLAKNGRLKEAKVKLEEILRLDKSNIDAGYRLKYISNELKRESQVLKTITQFQEGIQVTIQRIADLTKLPLEEAERILHNILLKNPMIGKYLKLEQVFVKGTLPTEKTVKEVHRSKTYTCSNCGTPITREQSNCSECNKEILSCSICKLPISFGDEIGSCSLCEVKGHLNHMQEWVKTQGKCPVCLQKLPVEGIVPIEEIKTKKK